jgi:hypothetical protein
MKLKRLARRCDVFHRLVALAMETALSPVAGALVRESARATTSSFTRIAARNCGAFRTGPEYTGDRAEGSVPSVV